MISNFALKQYWLILYTIFLCLIACLFYSVDLRLFYSVDLLT